MTKKENILKVLDYVKSIEEKEKETGKSFAKERGFNRILENVDLHQNILTEILEELVEKNIFAKAKDPLLEDKRHYPYSLINESERIKYREIRNLEKNKQFETKERSIKDFLREFVKENFTVEKLQEEFKGIESLFNYSENYPDFYTMLNKYALTILQYIIFKQSGIEIIFSSLYEDNDFFSLLSKHENKNIHLKKILGPIIALALELELYIRRENIERLAEETVKVTSHIDRLAESFQITIRFNRLEDLNKNELFQKIFSSELVDRDISKKPLDEEVIATLFKEKTNETTKLAKEIIQLLSDPTLPLCYSLFVKSVFGDWDLF